MAQLLAIRLVRAAGWRAIDWTQEARRVADIDAGLVDVPRHNRTSTDDCSVADGHRQNRCVRTDGHMIANICRPPQFSLAARRSSGCERVIDKHDPVADEAILADLDQLADEAMRLHLCTRAKLDTGLDLNKWANEAVVPNFTIV